MIGGTGCSRSVGLITRPLIATSSLPLWSDCRSLVVIISCSGVAPAWASPARAFHSGGARNQKAAAAASDQRTNIARISGQRRAAVALVGDRGIGGELLLGSDRFGRRFFGRWRTAIRRRWQALLPSPLHPARSLRPRAREVGRFGRNRAPRRRSASPGSGCGSAAIRPSVSIPCGTSAAISSNCSGEGGGGPPKSASAAFGGSPAPTSGSWCQLCLHDAQRTWRPPGGMAPSFTHIFGVAGGAGQDHGVGASPEAVNRW